MCKEYYKECLIELLFQKRYRKKQKFVIGVKIDEMDGHRIYLCIDLKSFYASVECVERGLDAMTTNLVVADAGRTEKTICLAVSPSLKAYGIPGRARFFEVVQRVKEINIKRKEAAFKNTFEGESSDENELKKNPRLALSYIIAPPRMAHYIEYSTRIYNIYLKYIAHEDIHVYSIDEVFIDITKYLDSNKMTAREFTMMILKDVLNTTGITAAAGLGTNMYLAKVAMDIVAKNAGPDSEGVRIAQLDEISYRKTLWTHRPLIDFWRVGRGYSKKLEAAGLYTMGDIARCSIGKENEYYNEELLYKMFGINAQLLIDHAWGWEPCTIADIKAYKPNTKSICSGQVLQRPYDYDKTRLIVREMTELLVLDLVEKKLVTDQMILTLGYDSQNIKNPQTSRKYEGEVTIDHYGRKTPKHARGSINLEKPTSSTKLIMQAVMELYEGIADKDLLVRRVNIVANNVVDERTVKRKPVYTQLDLFTDYDKMKEEEERREEEFRKERNLQEAMISIKKQFGKNSVLKGMNLQEGATTIDRNNQIGGHKA